MPLPTGLIVERRVVAHLRRYGAVHPSRAMGFAPARRGHARSLARLRAAGVVQGEPGAMWLDEPAWGARCARQRRRALALVAIAGVSLGIAGLTHLRG